MLSEEVSKNPCLAADLAEAQAAAARLREEVETAAVQNTLLFTNLGGARATLVRLEKYLLSSHGLSTRLAAEWNGARDQLEVAWREKAAKL